MDEYLYHHFYNVEQKHWWFIARQNILLHVLDCKLPSSKKQRLLDVGCGTGAILALLSSRHIVYGIDASPQAVEFCRSRGLTNLVTGSLGSYPKSDPFDVITLLDVIEHVDDDISVLRQAHHLLSEHGHILVTVPAFPFLWTGHDEVNHHKRRYTKSSLVTAVTSAGFEIRYLTFFNTLLFPVAVVKRMAAKILHTKGGSDLEMPSKPVNSLLRATFELETHLVPRLTLPFGLSLLCLARTTPS